MIIRWMAAFAGEDFSLEEMLTHEFERSTVEVAAEHFHHGDRSYSSTIRKKVGLLGKSTALVRKFKSDVYSSAAPSGKLYRTREDGVGYTTHTECWLKPRCWAGIVIRGKLSREDLVIVCKAALYYGMPLYRLNKDWTLTEMEIVTR